MADPARPAAPPADPLLLLASGSPRRRDLLAGAGVEFAVQPADIAEAPRPGEAPEAMALRLAAEKARAVAAGAPGRAVLGADTIVVLGDRVLGKPRDAAEALRMLGALQGRSHEVITAVAIVDRRSGEPPGAAPMERFAVRSRVHFRDADDAELRAYARSGEPLDKAGAYAVQGEGRRFVLHVEGSESNVIGLPIEETLAALGRLGLAPHPRSAAPGAPGPRP